MAKTLKNAYGKPVVNNLNGIDTGAIQKAEAQIAQYMKQLEAIQNQKAPTGYSPDDMKARQAFYERQEKEIVALHNKIGTQNAAIKAHTKKANGKSVSVIDGIPMALPKSNKRRGGK